MGHRAQPGHPEVQKVIQGGIATRSALAWQYLDTGALFVAGGHDAVGEDSEWAGAAVQRHGHPGPDLGIG